MPDVASVTVGIDLGPGIAKATQDLRAFTSKKYRFGFDNQFSGPLKSITGDIQSFDTSLTKATNRVVAFGAAAAVFKGAQAAFSAFARATIEVEDSLAKINVNLGESADGLKKFSSDLFNVARQTGQSFETAAKAAEEFARQGLSAEETIKRTRDALILSRIAALDSAEAVNDLTAAVNSYAKEALSTTDIINKFVALDTRFAVSSKDLADGLQRAGSVAADAGVSLDKFLGIITAVKQTTGRDGAVIGNALKTIFERTKSRDTIDSLEQLGVATKDLTGQLLPVDKILQNLAATYDTLSQAQQQQVSKQVANIQQINIFKALLNDLTKTYSVSKQAAEVSGNATDDALSKNIKLNQTLKSQIENTKTTVTQFFAALGNVKAGGLAKDLLGGFEKVRAFLSGDTGSKAGKQLGEGILKGISNVITGPGLAVIGLALGKAFKKVISVIGGDIKSAFGLNSIASQRAEVQERINNLVKQGTEAEIAQLKAATTLLAQKRALLAIEERIASISGASPLANSFIKTSTFGRSTIEGFGGAKGKVPNVAYRPNFADPVSKAIQREMAAGVPKHLIYVDKDKRVAGPDNPSGLVVANRRDEPVGGFQGVNRVLSEGGNPKKAGMVGNFAAGDASGPLSSYNAAREVRSLFNELAKVKTLGPDFERIGSKIFDASKKLNKAAQDNALGKLADQSNRLLFASKIVSDQSRKASPEQMAAYEASRAASTKGSSQTVFGRQRPTSTRPEVYGPFRTEAQAVGSVADKLGLPSIFGSQRRDARRLTDAGVSTESDAARGFLQNRNLQRADRRSNASLTAAIGLPFIAGLVPEGKGGTRSGQALGAASGALNGAGVGAILGGLPGAAIGGALGALKGIVDKTNKSLEEFTTEIDDATTAQSKVVDATNRVRGIGSQIKDIRDDNGDPRAIARLETQRREAIGGISDPKIQARLAAAGNNDDEVSKILDEVSDTLKKIEAGGNVSKQGFANNEKSTLEKIGNALQKPNRLLGGSGSIGNAASFIATGGLTGLINGAGKGLSQLGREKGITQLREEQRSLQGTISGALTNENVKGINVRELNQSEGTEEDAKKLSEIFKSLGAQVDVTTDNYRDSVAAISGAVLSFKNVKKAADEAASDPKFKGFGRGVLSSSPDLNTFSQAALLGRNPRAGRGAKAESTVGFFESLKDAKAINFDLETNTQFKQARAGTQAKRINEIGASFVQGNNPLARGLFDSRGDANPGAVQTALKSIAQGSNKQQAEKANILLAAIAKGIETLAREGVKPEGARLGNISRFESGDLDSGYQAGANYGTFAKGLKGSKGALTTKSIIELAADRPFRGESDFGRQYMTTKDIQGAAPKRRYDLQQQTKTFDYSTQGKYGGAFDKIDQTTSRTRNDESESRDADIAAALKMIKDASDVASANLSKAINEASIKVIVDVQGLTEGGDAGQLQADIQALFEKVSNINSVVAAQGGKPNPPSPSFMAPKYNPSLQSAFENR